MQKTQISKSTDKTKEIKLISEETQRLDDFLRKELPAHILPAGAETPVSHPAPAATISNSKIRRLILAGAVLVNGRPLLRPAFELRGRTTVTVHFDPDKFFFEKQPDDIKYEVSAADILAEDENLIFSSPKMKISYFSINLRVFPWNRQSPGTAAIYTMPS